jgi:hypothetical protein
MITTDSNLQRKLSWRVHAAAAIAAWASRSYMVQAVNPLFGSLPSLNSGLIRGEVTSTTASRSRSDYFSVDTAAGRSMSRYAIARRTAGGSGASTPFTARHRISFSSKSSMRSYSLKSIFFERSAP